jgi:hypothetical protein
MHLRGFDSLSYYNSLIQRQMKQYEFTLQERLDIHTAMLERYETLHDWMEEAKKADITLLADAHQDELNRINEIIKRLETE